MSTPYVGEIRLFAGNFAPVGWALCQGQLLPISENEVLFQLIGTTYGGDGQSTFSLPDLRGRVPLHQGPGFVIGQQGGVEQVTLTSAQVPSHNHSLQATAAAASAASGPSGSLLATASVAVYGSGDPLTSMAAQGLSPAGGSQPHSNMAPYNVLNYIISLFGVFPSQS